jgi:uncharacterized iron-regulated membrane protein
MQMTRQFFVFLHRWVGLSLTIFLVIIGLTGSVVAFQEELDHWLNPELFKVAIRDAPLLDPLALREKAQALETRAEADFLSLRQVPGESFSTVLTPKIDPATGKDYDLSSIEVFLDPYTGEKLGEREPMGESFTRAGIIAFIYHLHWKLALPETLANFGKTTVGIVALAWTIDCFVGFYLTFPLRLSVSQSDETGRSWWRRWKTAWLIRARSGAYRLNFDIHRAFGLWVWAMLFVFAWSGVNLNLDSVYRPVMKFAFGMDADTTREKAVEKPIDAPMLGWREAYARANDLAVQIGAQKGFTIEEETQLWLFRATGEYIYGVRTSWDTPKYGGTMISFDANSGALTRTSIPSEASRGDKITNWLVWLHMARVFGVPMQIFNCAMGFIITALSITGVYIWWKKRCARIKSRRVPAAASPARVSRSWRSVASVAWLSATAAAKRTQHSRGVRH